MTGTEQRMIKFTDKWSGFSLMIPESWRCETFGEVVLVFTPTESEPGALIWQLTLPEPTDIAELCRDILEKAARDDPSFKAATKPGGTQEQEKIMEFHKIKNNIPLRGELKVRLTGEDSAELTAIQAPVQEFTKRAALLWGIISSWEKTDSIPKEQFVEQSENAFAFKYPKDWSVFGKFERDQTGTSPGSEKIRWSVEDSSTGAKVYNDSMVLDFLFYPSGMFGNPMAQMTMANPQMSWKVQPFTNMKEFTETMILQLVRQQRPDFNLEKAVIDPGLEKLAREGFKPVEQNLGKRIELSAGYTVGTYTENGVKYKESSVICNWMIPETPNPVAMMAQPQYWFCSIGPILRAPQEIFADVSPILRGIAASYKTNPGWEQQRVDAAAQGISQDRENAEQQRRGKFEQVKANSGTLDMEIAWSRKESLEHTKRAGAVIFGDYF